MGQPFFRAIFFVVVLLSPCQLIQAVQNPLSLHDNIQPPTAISENSEGFPAGCKLYPSRRLLQCRNAQLRAIPEISPSWNVEIVDLSGNNISTVQFGSGYKNVKSVHLERNNITTMSEGLILQVQNFLWLSLGGNPFYCDCKLEWLRERLLGIGRNHDFPRLTHIDSLICASPASLEGKSLVHLSKEVLCGYGPVELSTTTTPKPTAQQKNTTKSTEETELAKTRLKTMEKGRIAEIIGVTLAFAVVIVIMSVAFIVM